MCLASAMIRGFAAVGVFLTLSMKEGGEKKLSFISYACSALTTLTRPFVMSQGATATSSSLAATPPGRCHPKTDHLVCLFVPFRHKGAKALVQEAHFGQEALNRGLNALFYGDLCSLKG